MFFIFCLFALNPTCHSGAEWNMHSALSSYFLLQQSLSEVDLAKKDQMSKGTQETEGTQKTDSFVQKYTPIFQHFFLLRCSPK